MARYEIRMPRLSDSMTEGKVIKWVKRLGEYVRKGEPLAEIETDKATLELDSPYEGYLVEIHVEAGKTVGVGTVLAIVSSEKEVSLTPSPPSTPPSPSISPPPPSPTPTPFSTPSPSPLPSQEEVPVRVKATPLARKLAQEKGVDLTRIRGTGPGGRITLGDVEGYLESIGKGSQPPGGVEIPARPSVEPLEVPSIVIPLSRMRRSIAESMSKAKRETPHFYVRIAIKMESAIEMKKALEEIYSDRRISWTAIFIRAIALSLKELPRLNACYVEENGVPSVKVYQTVNIGVAVAVDEGLVLPVLRNVENAKIPEIALKLQDLAERTRGGKLKAEELSGATFSLSNLGMAGVEEFAAVIPPGQACILAVGKIGEEVSVEGGQLKVRKVMKATLSADHRVVDGWGAAEFLEIFRKKLENPYLLIEE